VDKDVSKGVTYHYTFSARDESGLYSDYGIAVFASPIDRGLIPIVKDLQANAKDKKVILAWSYPEKDDNTFFIIYKKVPNGKLKQYKKTTELELSDTNVNKGTYEYSIRAYTTKGRQSLLSDTQGIEVK